MADSVTGTRPDVLLIGDFEVDPAALEVRRDGHSSRLEPKVMDVLLLLASHAGEVVTRTDFEHAVWAGRVVGYDALANAISKLRREFGDTGRQRSYIETVSKTGYRLVAPVRRPEEVAHFVQLSRSGTGTSSPSLQQPARGLPVRAGILTAAIALLALTALGWWFISSPQEPVAEDVPPGIAVVPFVTLGDTGQPAYWQMESRTT